MAVLKFRESYPEYLIAIVVQKKILEKVWLNYLFVQILRFNLKVYLRKGSTMKLSLRTLQQYFRNIYSGNG